MPAEIVSLFPTRARARPAADVIPEITPKSAKQIATDRYGNTFIDIRGTYSCDELLALIDRLDQAFADACVREG